MFARLATTAKRDFNADRVGFCIIWGTVLAVVLGIGVCIFAAVYSEPLVCTNGQTVHTRIQNMPVPMTVGKVTTIRMQPVVTEYCA